MDDAIVSAVREHAALEAPRECCGVVVAVGGRQVYRPCRNLSAVDSQFEIDPLDLIAARRQGEIKAICHSHVFVSPQPSPADRVECERSGLPWLIVNHPTGAAHWFEPTGYSAPLLGRLFVHGVLDCYSLIRDWYQRELGVTLMDFERADDWWIPDENGRVCDLYRENFDRAGFVPVEMSALRRGDMIVMRIRAPLECGGNHAGVYLGDQVILQHLQGRLSSRDVYGGWFIKNTTHCMRHRSQL
jgi:proteasome lid subunit RPN8/RPN11